MKNYSETLTRALAPLDVLYKMDEWDKYDTPDKAVSNHFRVWCKEHNDWERHDVYLKSDGTFWHILGLNHIPLNPETHVVCWDTNYIDVNGNVIMLYDRVKFVGNDFYGTTYEGIVKRLVYENKTCYVIEFDRTVECKCRETDYRNGTECIPLDPKKLEVMGSELELQKVHCEEGAEFYDELIVDHRELGGQL